MQPANNFIVLNILEYLKNEDKRLGEDKLVQILSEFSCPLNMDVERFLQYQAGGIVVFVEADDEEKLLSFYKNYGFKRFDARQTVSREAEPHELIQLLRLL